MALKPNPFVWTMVHIIASVMIDRCIIDVILKQQNIYYTLWVCLCHVRTADIPDYI